MRMKMFSADSFDAAQAMILAEFGDEAIILSEREVEGGVEVRAAVDRLPPAGMTPKLVSSEPEPQPVLRDDSPIRREILDLMTWHGAADMFADVVARTAERVAGPETELRHALASGLEGVIPCAPMPALPERNVILIGPPGAGRTATAAKLTRRAAMAKHELVPVAADFDATAGGAQLSAYLEREQKLIEIAPEPGALFSKLKALSLRGARAVIDLPAINPFDPEDMDRLRDLLSAIEAEPILVLSAEGHPDDLAEAAHAFANIGARRAVISKLDVVRRRGGVFAALASARLSLSHLAVTPFIGGGLVPAAPGRIASLLMEDAPGRQALKGAA